MKHLISLLICTTLFIASCTKKKTIDNTTNRPIIQTNPAEKIVGTYTGRVMRIFRSVDPYSPNPVKIDTSYIDGSVVISRNKDSVRFQIDFLNPWTDQEKRYVDSNHYKMTLEGSHFYEFAHIYAYPANDSVYLFNYAFAGSGGSIEKTRIFAGKRDHL